MDWRLSDIRDLKNKVAVVTGSNSGLGFEVAKALALKNCSVILAVRNLDKGSIAIESIKKIHPTSNLHLYKLDLTDLSSIQNFSENVKKDFKGIDFLINNAGVMNVPYSRTVDGFETQFGGNHLGHFALTGRLLDFINENGRVVTVSSFLASRGIINFDDLNSEKYYSASKSYSQSKLANLIFALELQKRLEKQGKNISSLAAHPGYSSTNLFSKDNVGLFSLIMEISSKIFAQSASQGAFPILRAALDENAKGGEFYGPAFLNIRGRPVKVPVFKNALDPNIAERLWKISEELTKVHYL